MAALDLKQLRMLARGTCEVRGNRKPAYCPAWPRCGCQFCAECGERIAAFHSCSRMRCPHKQKAT